MRRVLMLWVLGLPAIAAAAVAQAGIDAYLREGHSIRQWKLPDKLREISGLTVRDERLFAHGDETAIVYEVDYEHGRLIKAFALGKPTVKGDFEGIATAGERFFLVTSDGVLYEFAEGVNGERVGYERYPTGVGRLCEVEGLVFDAASGHLLLICKQPRIRALRDLVAVFAWSPSERRLVPEAHVMIAAEELAGRIPGAQFNPSGIEIDPRSGNFFVVAARQRAVAEVRRDGSVVRAARLPRASLHRQAEGIALLPDGRLVLADEGGSKKARLAVYRPES